jgi:rubrerythrin
MAKNFKDPSEQEILALAISSEETDARIYADFAAGLKTDYPATAQIFKEMEAEEDEHRRKLIEDYRRRFGEHIPLIRREDVKGFVNRKPVWMIRPLGIKTVRRQAEIMETETRHFYECAAGKVSDASTRKLLGDLAEAERKHVTLADNLEKEYLTPDVKAQEEKAHRRLFVLQIVQPGLAGLMDGSVSTLAPVFAAAFATHNSHAALRGFVCGLMTTAGGIGHTLPYLIPNFRTATAIAVVIVAIELLAISWIRNRYMDTPFLRAAFQVIVGGVLVFLVGIWIGSS